MMTHKTFIINVSMEDREDGGLRVRSDELPGLVLSGHSKIAVCAMIKPAILAILRHQGFENVSVRAAEPFSSALRRPSPRDVAVDVVVPSSNRSSFVVELDMAA